MGLELTEAVFGERSSERREFCKGEGESESDLATPLLSLLTRGVAGDAFLGVSDIIAEDLDLEDMVVVEESGSGSGSGALGRKCVCVIVVRWGWAAV